MTDLKNPAGMRSGSVDWDDPVLAALLKKSEGWELDNRRTFKMRLVEITIGWAAGKARRAAVVWERDNVIVLETDFPIAQGMRLRIEKYGANTGDAPLGTLLESRLGTREKDQGRTVHVHWVSLG